MVKIEKLPTDQINKCKELIPDWFFIDEKYIKKEFTFSDFKTGLEFLNIIGDIAEMLDHHPRVTLSYTRLLIELSTDSIQAISELDIELARRIDNSHKKYKDLKGE